MTTTKTTKTRRIVDALDDLRSELRLSNVLQALALGMPALEHDEGKRATSDLAKARTDARNELRAEARTALGLEVTS